VFNRATFILAAFSVLGVLIATYLNSPEVDIGVVGNRESFGQFGDYIGGILNPIFGFITVLLLLSTLKLQGRESDRLRNISIKNDVKALLEDALINFKKAVEADVFEIRSGSVIKKTPLALFFLHHPESGLANEFKTYRSFLENNENPTGIDIVRMLEENRFYTENYSEYKKIYRQKKYILELYCEVFKSEDNPIVKKYVLSEFDSYLVNCFFSLRLIDRKKYNFLYDEALNVCHLIEKEVPRTFPKSIADPQ
jgi:hypothetical protein